MRLRCFTIVRTNLATISFLLNLDPPTSSPYEQRMYQQIAWPTVVCTRISDVLRPGRDMKEASISCIKTAPVQQGAALYGAMGGLGLFVLWRSRRRRKNDET